MNREHKGVEISEYLQGISIFTLAQTFKKARCNMGKESVREPLLGAFYYAFYEVNGGTCYPGFIWFGRCQCVGQNW